MTCIEDDKLSKIRRGVASPPVHKPLRNYLSYVLIKNHIRCGFHTGAKAIRNSVEITLEKSFSAVGIKVTPPLHSVILFLNIHLLRVVNQ